MIEGTLLKYLIVSTVVSTFMGFMWTRNNVTNFLTKFSYILLAGWGIYEIVRMVM